MKPIDETHTPHDEWVKRALSLWLDGLGDVQVDARIAGTSRRGDVVYSEKGNNKVRRRKLGLLGEVARGRVLFELFRNAVTAWEIMTCAVKAVEDTGQHLRAARRKKDKASSVKRTALCLVTPSMSVELSDEAELTLIDPAKPGVYRMARLWSAVVVVVDKLANDPSTLWFRLLGRGSVQAEAVAELLQMSEREPLRDATFALLVAWRQSLPELVAQTEAEREMAMNWQQVYERWERKVKAAGRKEGEVEGLRKGKAKGLREGEAKGLREGEAKGLREGEVKGLREGKAQAIIAVVESRGLRITQAEREHLLACTDLAQLDAWLRSAVATPSVATLLGMRPQRRRRK